MSTQRKAVAAIVLVTLLVLGAGAWFWWLPSVARARAAGLLEERLGLRTSIGETSLSFSGVVFQDIALQGERGGLAIQIAEAGVRGGLLSLASQGAAAAHHVELRGANLELDVARGGVASLSVVLGRLEGQRASVTPGGPGAMGGQSRRLVEVKDGHLRLSDAVGELAVGSFEGRYQGGHVRLTGTTAQVGQPPADVLTVPAWELHLRGATVLEARAHEPSVVLGSGPETTVARLSAALGALAEMRGQGADTEDLEDDAQDGVPAWMGTLADGATIEIQALRVSRDLSSQRRVLLQGLTAGVERVGAELHLTGEGEVQGGRTRWDLWIEPGAARGRGTFEARQLPFDLLLPMLPTLPWWRPELGRVDADLGMRGDSSGRIAVEGQVAVMDIGLSDPRIAPVPVGGLGFAVSGSAVWVPSERRLELLSARLKRGSAEVHLTGDLERSGDYFRAAVRATLQPTLCDTVVAAVPASLLAELVGFAWRGRMGGQLELDVDSRDLDATHLRLRVADGCEFLAVPAIADLRRFQRPFVHRVQEPDGSVFEMTTGPGSDNWAPLPTVSPFLIHAVLAHEDAGFFRHAGFSVSSIRDALARNLREGRYVVGASTITMQLAKNLFLHREKTLARKLQEVILTWWLESALTKEQILELYLNVIEYGPAVYGIANAAAHYFGREPSELSPAESAFLACVLPNPKVFHGSWERGELTSSMRRRIGRFLRHLQARGRIDQEALELGLSELEQFRFVHPGEAAAPRSLRGSAAALPWELRQDASWGEESLSDDDGFEDELDAADEGG